MNAPNEVDYPTDEESDEDQGFTIKVPDLEDLINEFEKDDDVVHNREESIKSNIEDLKSKAQPVPRRIEIKDKRMEKMKFLDANITKKRAEFCSRLPGKIEDMNEVIVNSKNKLYLR